MINCAVKLLMKLEHFKVDGQKDSLLFVQRESCLHRL